METRLLDTIQTPQDLKRLDYRELEQLCGEIRAYLIDTVATTGGHLSSNLGVIELTVALHWALKSPEDMLVFDVGHQCYTHKILTGRRDGFAGLRQAGGLSGFPAPHESEHDIFLAGHGSTSISAAVGLAQAKKLRGRPGLVVAVIGDGAFTGGMIYEAINNIGSLDNLVVVLNDNTMSISKNVGALAKYFTSLRTNPRYYKAKTDVKNVLDQTPVVGRGIIRGVQSVKSAFRRSLYHSTFFEEMGFEYVGPIDGHNLPELCNLFSHMRKEDMPLFIHLETRKGKGFQPAERNPGAFHGVSSFNAQKVSDPDNAPGDSFSVEFGRELTALGDTHKNLCAVTAAMKYGTGLQFFKKAHTERFFDVGMAEQHAVTFSAGLAANGMLPVVAVYSTFLQRAYDQIIHDVVLQNLDVLFAIDRAGLVPGDGETHQGIYDAAFLSQQPNLPIIAPANYAELHHWLAKLLAGDYKGPRAIRYPRGNELGSLRDKPCTGRSYDHLLAKQTPKAAIVSYGREIAEAQKAAELLAQRGTDTDLFGLVQINPIPQDLVQALLRYPVVLFAEEGVQQGGIGEHMARLLCDAGFKGEYLHHALQNNVVGHAAVETLLAQNGLDAQSLAALLGKSLRFAS